MKIDQLENLNVKCYCGEILKFYKNTSNRFFYFKCMNKNCNSYKLDLITGILGYYSKTYIKECHIQIIIRPDHYTFIYNGFYYSANPSDYNSVDESYFCLDEERFLKLLNLDFNQIEQKYQDLLLFK